MGQALREAIADMFTAAELEVVVASLPAGHLVTGELPASSESRKVFAFRTLQVLERLGLVNADLITTLVRARPLRLGRLQQAAVEARIDVSTADYVSALVAGKCPTEAAELLEESRGPLDNLPDSTVIKLTVLRMLSGDAMLTTWNAVTRMLPDEPATPREWPRLALKVQDTYRKLRVDLARHGDPRQAAQQLRHLAWIVSSSRSGERCRLIEVQIEAWWANPRRALGDLVPLLAELLRVATKILDRYVESAATPAPRHAPILRCSGVSKKYPDNDFKLTVDALEVYPGDVLGIVGPNGGGKSSLLRILAAESPVSAGTLTFPALGLAEPRAHPDWHAIKAQIRYIPQQPARWDDTLEVNLRVWATMLSPPPNKRASAEEHRQGLDGDVEYLIERLDLRSHRHKTWDQLSAGFRVRLEISRAFLGNPRLLILDEPLAHLDLNAQASMLKDLRDLMPVDPQPAIILSSQQIHEIEPFVQQILFLNKLGNILYQDRPERIGETYDVRAFELRRELTPATVSRIRERFPDCKFSGHDDATLLELPKDSRTGDLLPLLDEEPGGVHVRDISGSAAFLMRKERSVDSKTW